MLIIKRGIGCLRKCKDTIAIAIVLVYSWLCKWHIPVFSGTKIHHLSHSVWLSILCSFFRDLYLNLLTAKKKKSLKWRAAIDSQDLLHHHWLHLHHIWELYNLF
jgi:hypothetical protein